MAELSSGEVATIYMWCNHYEQRPPTTLYEDAHANTAFLARRLYEELGRTNIELESAYRRLEKLEGESLWQHMKRWFASWTAS